MRYHNEAHCKSHRHRARVALACKFVRIVRNRKVHFVNRYSYRTQKNRDAAYAASKMGWLKAKPVKRRDKLIQYVIGDTPPTEAEIKQHIQAAKDPRWPKPAGGWGS